MHLSSELALDLLDGRSEASQEATLNAHIEECEDCRRRFQRWSQVRFLLKRAHLVRPPAELRAKAERIFEPEPPEQETIRRIVAEIIFDSPMQTSAVGARGTAAGRQMVLVAEHFDIHIMISGDPPERKLIGQIFDRRNIPVSGSTCLFLLQGGERAGMSTVDRFGAFQFDDVPQGVLSLHINLPNATVVGELD